MATNEHPTGTVTFLFTDIEGSTRLWEEDPNYMRSALVEHDSLLRSSIEAQGGYVFKTVGDAFCAAFVDATDSLKAALNAQVALSSRDGRIRVRMAIHTGYAETRDGDYFGQPLNRVARLLAIGHGGQTLLSEVARDLSLDGLPKGCTLRTLGEHRLKDLGRPEPVFQLCHSALEDDFPPLRSLDNPLLPNNLPQQVTTFIGRERELAEIRDLLTKTRLLTLTGPGGTGKTRLALQTAADMLDSSLRDGVWIVELAPVANESLVPLALATALEIGEETSQDLTRSIAKHLRDKQILILLDNCEHVLIGAAKLVSSLLQSCSGIRIIATSREPLAIAGELTYRVPTLSLPDPRKLVAPEALSAYEAVQLFIERAQFYVPYFGVDNQNAPALASVVHRLDGIPLALELAAARMRSMSVQELNERLDQRFKILTGGSRTAMPRQQTLRSLIDWSYDLLSDEEKLLLCRLSVFVGGWTLEAAEAACSDDHLTSASVLDLLTSLSDKSLIVADRSTERTRYAMLETIRQYAVDRMSDDLEIERLRDKHLDYFTRFAEEAEPKITSAEQQLWLDRLESDHSNLSAAIEWGLGRSETSPLSLRVVAAMWRFWLLRNYYAEGRRRLYSALSASGNETRNKARARALNAAGALAWREGGFPPGMAQTLAALEIARELGDENILSNALNILGSISTDEGDFVKAKEYLLEGVTIRRKIGDKFGLANSLNNLGKIHNSTGDSQAAREFHLEALALRRELGDAIGVATSLNNLGTVASHLDDDQSALQYHLEALDIGRNRNERTTIAIALSNLGAVTQRLGDASRALTYHREALETQWDLGDRWGVNAALETMAPAVSELGQPDNAALLWGVVENLREEISSPRSPDQISPYERDVANARRAFGDDVAFDAAWQRGRELPLAAAVKLALEMC